MYYDTGNIYVVGTTFGTVPTVNPIQPNPGSPSDAFVAKIEVRRISARSNLFDFEGDGSADISVLRPSNGTWYLNNSQSVFPPCSSVCQPKY